MKSLILLTIAATVAPLGGGLPQEPGQQSKPTVRTPEDVVNLLEGVLQPRFLDRSERFGLSRIIILPGHDDVRLALGNAPSERSNWSAVTDSSYEFLIGFVHLNRPPAEYTRFINGELKRHVVPVGGGFRHFKADRDGLPMTPVYGSPRSPSTPGGPIPTVERWTEFAAKAASTLMKGKPVDQKVGDQWIAYRPVIASQKQCLSCHTQSKLGDTLGALAYQVFPKPAVSQTAKKP